MGMPQLTPRAERPSPFGEVVLLRGEVWHDDRLATRQTELAIEWRFSHMPRVTESSYRENAGRESLTISLLEGEEINNAGWEETFEFLGSTPARRFVEFANDEFVGVNADGEAKTPGAITILKTFHKEALRRGFVLGVQTHNAKTNANGVPSDAFRVVLRRNVKQDKLPKGYQTMIADGVEQDLIETE